MCTRLSFFYLKSRRVSFEVYLTTSHDTFGTMCIIYKSHIVLFAAILTLQNAGVHVHALNSCNMSTNIETSVDKTLGLRTTLNILYINPDHCHIGFRGSFNHLEARSKNNDIEYMGSLNITFDGV